jgi:hypothetical protein
MCIELEVADRRLNGTAQSQIEAAGFGNSPIPPHAVRHWLRPVVPQLIGPHAHPRMPRPPQLPRRPDPREPYRLDANDPRAVAAVPEFRHNTVGAARHAFIQSLLHAGYRSPTAEEISEAARRSDWVRAQRGPQRELMALRHLINPAAIYFGRHTPANEWELIGTEIAVAATSFDAVWSLPDGAIFADEFKTGRSILQLRLDLAGQFDRQLEAGAVEWDTRFLGVRRCVLAAPWLSDFIEDLGVTASRRRDMRKTPLREWENGLPRHLACERR